MLGLKIVPAKIQRIIFIKSKPSMLTLNTISDFNLAIGEMKWCNKFIVTRD
jgi:hypothetical protein